MNGRLIARPEPVQQNIEEVRTEIFPRVVVRRVHLSPVRYPYPVKIKFVTNDVTARNKISCCDTGQFSLPVTENIFSL